MINLPGLLILILLVIGVLLMIGSLFSWSFKKQKTVTDTVDDTDDSVKLTRFTLENTQKLLWQMFKYMVLLWLTLIPLSILIASIVFGPPPPDSEIGNGAFGAIVMVLFFPVFLGISSLFFLVLTIRYMQYKMSPLTKKSPLIFMPKFIIRTAILTLPFIVLILYLIGTNF